MTARKNEAERIERMRMRKKTGKREAQSYHEPKQQVENAGISRSHSLPLFFTLTLYSFPNEMGIQVTTSAKYTDICTLTHTAHMCTNTCITRLDSSG